MDTKLYRNVAEWLGKTNDLLRLSKIEEIADNGRYYVTMWGHYSAGKSKLINNLLGKDILPVRSRETTAVLTYIQLGMEEECRIIYDNGMNLTVAIDEAKNIYQKEELNSELQKIDHIEISVNCDFLKSGLVLVDTPGVNTLIRHHQDLATEAIEQSGKIVYVLGNSPSNVDRNFIKQIDSCGIDILFVRTKCDVINEEEESAEEALDFEKNELMQFLNRECIFIPVSNEKGNKWNENISILQNEINLIADSTAIELEKAIIGRLKVFAKLYAVELEEVCRQIASALTGDSEKLNNEIFRCDNEIKRLENLEKQLESKIEDKIERSKKASARDMECLVNELVDKFDDFIKYIPCSESMDEKIKHQYDMVIQQAVEEMQLMMNSYFDEIISEEHETIVGTKEYISLSEAPTYTEIQIENTRILEMYNTKLLEVKNELERIIVERQAVNIESSDIRESYDDNIYEEALVELDNALREVPSGSALRMADRQDIQPSSVFKKIGQTADIALLLLPGDVIVNGIKAFADTTKIAQMIHKMGKAGQVIVKAGGVAAQNAKAIDRVRDTVYTLNNVMGKRRYSTAAEKEQAKVLVDKAAQKAGEAFGNYKAEKQSGNLLDALSVAFWTEKLGACFDKPPKMEVDIAEEESRNRLRQEITSEKKRLSEERMIKKKEMGLVKTKEKELEMMEQEKRIVKEQIEAEIASQEAELIEKARIQASILYKQKYKTYLEKNLRTASQMLRDEYYATANQNIVLYVSTRNSDLMKTIQEKKAMLKELSDAKEHGDSELKAKLELGQKYLNVVKELV